MKILDRYLLKQFLSALIFSLFIFWVIFLVVDLIENLDTFIDRQAGVVLVVQYYLFYTPFILILTLPIAMLLSTLFSVGLLAKGNEITAMKSTGISLYRILFPIFFISLVISLLAMAFGEYVIPYANQKKREIKTIKIEKRTWDINQPRENIFLQVPGNYIFYLRYYDAKGKFGQDALLQRFEDNKLVEQIEGERVFWKNPGWLFLNGRERLFSDSLQEGEVEKYKQFEHLLKLDLKILPEALERKPKPADEMNYQELKELILAKERTGQDTSVEQTDLHLKITFPLVSFIIVLFGATFAANPRRSGMAVGIAVSLFIGFIYYTLIRASQSLGYSHKLPPLLAAWIANIFFAILGIILLIKAKK